MLATGIGLVPGRPTILASLAPAPERRARVAIGLPGYPIAAAMVAREILGPLVSRLLGAPHARPATREAVAEILRCTACDHREHRPVAAAPGVGLAADPAGCDSCNP